MKATCSREGLIAAFQVAGTVVPQRSPQEILKCVKLQIEAPADASLLATDLELGIRYAITGVQADGNDTIVMPVSHVTSILRELSDDQVALETSDAGLTIRSASSRFELTTFDPGQFPDVPFADDAGAHRVKAGALLNLIRRTSFACAGENSRYALHSVFVEFDEGRIKFVATDSKRLALCQAPVELAEESSEGSWLLPPKALQLLARVLTDPEEEVQLVLHDNDALFRTSKITAYTRLVEGRFPRYQDVFPSEVAIRIPLPVGAFYSVVRQARILTNEESRGVIFRFADGQLTVQSQAAQLGQSEVTMPIAYNGEPVQVTYDPQLLIDALRILDPEEELQLEMADSRRASVFRTRDDYAYVVMPLLRDQ